MSLSFSLCLSVSLCNCLACSFVRVDLPTSKDRLIIIKSKLEPLLNQCMNIPESGESPDDTTMKQNEVACSVRVHKLNGKTGMNIQSAYERMLVRMTNGMCHAEVEYVCRRIIEQSVADEFMLTSATPPQPSVSQAKRPLRVDTMKQYLTQSIKEIHDTWALNEYIDEY